MAAMTFSPTKQCPQGPGQFHVPPIHQVTIPSIQQMTFQVPQAHAGGTFQQGRGGGRGRGGRSQRGGRGGGRGRTPFADHMQSVGRGGVPQVPVGGRGIQTPRRVNPPNSNVYKIHNNWNVCFSCGFDVEDNNTSQMCPAHWRKMNHQDSYTRENAQQFINAGYDPCTKGMHKTVLPTGGYN